MSFQIANYEYLLDGYTENAYSLKEYKTTNIIVNENECGIVKVTRDKYNDSDNSDLLLSSSMTPISSVSSMSSMTSTSSDFQPKKYKLHSCDHFTSNVVETDENIQLKIDDKNKELYFVLKFEDIELSSYDFVEIINKFGAKKLQKNFSRSKIFEYFRNSNIYKIYEPKNAVKIAKKVREILKKINSIDKEIESANFKNLVQDIDSRRKYNKKNTLKDLNSNEYLDYIQNYINLLYNHDEKQKTYIKFLNPQKTDKYIIFGDYHGSFSTFVRNLLRFRKMNIIDENGKIKDDYYLIFLGDIVDRGIYSYEILIILYLLLINNPNNIVINRGNHEEMVVNSKISTNMYFKTNIDNNVKLFIGTFFDELLGKFQKVENMLEIYTEIYNVMILQSSAIICSNPNTREFIYMCHGCLPHDKNNANKLNGEIKEKIKLRKNFFINASVGYSTRWNDFYGKEETIRSSRTYSYDNPLIKKIGKKVLEDANSVGIKFVIRGHEDLNYNLKLMKDNDSTWISAKKFDEKNNDYKCLDENDVLGNMTHILECDGDLMTINKVKTNFLPVITISTNTDIGKNLTHDSYIILSFNNNFKNTKCILYGGKYHKYVDKIMRLKQL